EEKDQATKKFQQISEAYEVLSDAEKRKIYDLQGKDGLNQQNFGNGPNPFDIFSQFFNMNGEMSNFGGFNRGNGRNGNNKNENTEFVINISLKDVMTGLKKKLKVSRKIIKNSQGEKIDIGEYSTTWKLCDTCHGNGHQ